MNKDSGGMPINSYNYMNTFEDLPRHSPTHPNYKGVQDLPLAQCEMHSTADCRDLAPVKSDLQNHS